MSAIPRPLTYDDLLAMPDDGMRREVIGGTFFEIPAATAGHQVVVGNLLILLYTYAREYGGHMYPAPFDVVLGPSDIVQPDLLFLLATRPRVPQDPHAFNGSPDLVIEVISPGTAQTDHRRKMALYTSAKVPEYWIADPVRHQLVVYVLDGEEYIAVEPDADGLIASSILSGLRVDPAEVFAGLDA
jgi:Uma2 family endonuclease